MGLPAILVGMGVRALFSRLAGSGFGYMAAPAATRVVYSPGFINGAPQAGSAFSGAADNAGRLQDLFSGADDRRLQNTELQSGQVCTLDSALGR